MSDVTAGQRSRRVVSFGQVQTGGIARGSSPLARPDAPNLFESRRALTKTGAVRVRWDREQLIGGKPERLVSRVLRVLAGVLDQVELPDMTEVWIEPILRNRLGRRASRRRDRR